MTNLSVNTAEQFRTFILEHLQGGKNLSIRGVAKMAGIAHNSLISSGSFNSARLAEKLTTQGFEGGSFSKSGIPPLAVMLN